MVKDISMQNCQMYFVCDDKEKGQLLLVCFSSLTNDTYAS